MSGSVLKSQFCGQEGHVQFADKVTFAAVISQIAFTPVLFRGLLGEEKEKSEVLMTGIHFQEEKAGAKFNEQSASRTRPFSDDRLQTKGN